MFLSKKESILTGGAPAFGGGAIALAAGGAPALAGGAPAPVGGVPAPAGGTPAFIVNVAILAVLPRPLVTFVNAMLGP